MRKTHTLKLVATLFSLFIYTNHLLALQQSLRDMLSGYKSFRLKRSWNFSGMGSDMRFLFFRLTLEALSLFIVS